MEKRDCFIVGRDIAIPQVHRMGYFAHFTEKMQHYKRKIWIHFRGEISDDVMYSYGVRQSLREYFRNMSSNFFFSRVYNEKVYSLDKKTILFSDQKRGNISEELKDSVLCLMPIGWQTWTSRLYDFLALGCIPVIISDGLQLPFEWYVDWKAFTFKYRHQESFKIIDDLLHKPYSEIVLKQKNMLIWREQILYDQDYRELKGAMRLIIAEFGLRSSKLLKSRLAYKSWN
jgi:hypothetical protein